MNFVIIITTFGSILLEIGFATGIAVYGKLPKQNSDLWATLNKKAPIIVSHRGEMILMPEHTLAAYEIAAIEGADYIEPDLVLTQDGRLVCFHDLSLRSGTDVRNHPEFANKMKNFTDEIGGVTINNDWFIHDFTLAELKQLHVTQAARGIRPQYFNDMFTIPTFEEYLDVIHKMAHLQNRSIGVIPEVKSPRFHNSLWSSNYMENLLLTTLKSYGYPVKQSDIPQCTHINNMDTFGVECGDVIIQSFDFDCIKYLSTQTDMDLLALGDTKNLGQLTYDGLKEVASVAQHFHVSKELLHTGIEAFLHKYNVSYDEEYIASLGGFIPPQEIVKEAHEINLKVGIYTIYDSHEDSERGCHIECEPQDKENEMFYFFVMGVDGLFVENIQEALELRIKFGYQLQLEQLINSGRKLVVSRGVTYAIVTVFFILHSYLKNY